MSFDIRTRLSQLKSSAKARRLNVNIDINQLQYLINLGCEFCGDDLSKENGYCLDRVDSSKGYIISNVVPCCKICNRAKSNMDAIAFVEWIQKANKHMQNKIETIDKLKDFGITEEMYYELCDVVFKNKTKDLPKERLKVVNTNNKEK